MKNNDKQGFLNPLKIFIKSLLKKKTPDEIIETAKNSELKKTLNAFDLIMLGIGAVIGTGIFTDRKSTRLNSSH